MAGLILHNGEKGTANELSVSNLLTKAFPPSVRIASGEIIDGANESAPQMDVVVLSNTFHPQIFAQTDEKLFPVESVLLCVEVKTTLTPGELRDIAKKIKKFRKLRSSTGQVPELALFAHKAGSSPRATANWFFELGEDERPAFFLINDSALLGISDVQSEGGYQITMPFSPKPGEEESYTFGDAPTMEKGYWKPVDLPKGDQVRVDHGAAMLFFLHESLKILSERDHADIAWLDTYLSQVPQQHVRFSPGKPGKIERPDQP